MQIIALPTALLQQEIQSWLRSVVFRVKINISGLVVVKIKHYLVDSENVNDNWLMLLDMADENDEIIIFLYEKNSPHMAYASVIKLLQEKNARFSLKSASRDRMLWISSSYPI